MKVTQTKSGGDVRITLSLDQSLALASLLAYVGDREAGPLAGLYDAIGDAIEYKNGERIGYSLYDAVERRREYAQRFFARAHDYFVQRAKPNEVADFFTRP
jgi:hypothetical protein